MTIEINHNLFLKIFIKYMPLYIQRNGIIKNAKNYNYNCDVTATFSMERAESFSSRPLSTHPIILVASVRKSKDCVSA